MNTTVIRCEIFGYNVHINVTLLYAVIDKAQNLTAQCCVGDKEKNIIWNRLNDSSEIVYISNGSFEFFMPTRTAWIEIGATQSFTLDCDNMTKNSSGTESGSSTATTAVETSSTGEPQEMTSQNVLTGSVIENYITLTTTNGVDSNTPNTSGSSTATNAVDTPSTGESQENSSQKHSSIPKKTTQTSTYGFDASGHTTPGASGQSSTVLVAVTVSGVLIVILIGLVLAVIFVHHRRRKRSDNIRQTEMLSNQEIDNDFVTKDYDEMVTGTTSPQRQPIESSGGRLSSINGIKTSETANPCVEEMYSVVNKVRTSVGSSTPTCGPGTTDGVTIVSEMARLNEGGNEYSHLGHLSTTAARMKENPYDG